MYADPADYYDICLLIFECANHRNEADIRATWDRYIEEIRLKAEQNPQNSTPRDAVIEMIRDMSRRLKNSDITFSPATIIPLMENFSATYVPQPGNTELDRWLPDLFIEVGFPFDTILGILQNLYLNGIAPISGPYRRVVGRHMVDVIWMWHADCIRSNQRIFGTEENATDISQILQVLVQDGIDPAAANRAGNLRRQIDRSYT